MQGWGPGVGRPIEVKEEVEGRGRCARRGAGGFAGKPFQGHIG